MAEARGLGPRQCEFDSRRPYYYVGYLPTIRTLLWGGPARPDGKQALNRRS